MPKTTTEKLDEYVIEILRNAGYEGDKLSSMLIIYKSFYNEIKQDLDISKVPLRTRKNIIFTFFRFVQDYHLICIRAYKPLSGSFNVDKDIISMYSRKEISFAGKVKIESKS